MTGWEAIVLGVVEGLTEYLPVSSTGHLLLVQRALGIERTAASDAYAICIQAGAILAVLGLYWRRVAQMVRGIAARVGLPLAGEAEAHRAGWRLAVNIVVAFLPAAVFGLLFDEMIEERLFGLWPIVTAWLIGGLAILVVAWRQRVGRSVGGDARGENAGAAESSGRRGGELVELSWLGALSIGAIQCLAMWPGTSRSLVTIVGGVLVGLSLPAAVEFSFLLGVVTLLAATLYKAQAAGETMLAAYGWEPLIWGSLAAWLSAVLAVKWMVSYLRRYGLELFGYYRVALAVVVAILLHIQWLQPV